MSQFVIALRAISEALNGIADVLSTWEVTLDLGPFTMRF